MGRWRREASGKSDWVGGQQGGQTEGTGQMKGGRRPRPKGEKWREWAAGDGGDGCSGELWRTGGCSVARWQEEPATTMGERVGRDRSREQAGAPGPWPPSAEGSRRG